MTKIIQYIHRPNNTELGKGNTHENYLLIGKDYDLADIFPNGMDIALEAVDSGKEYTVRAAVGNEFRINQFGQLYRDYNVCEGDEIIITVVDNSNSRNYNIRVNKYNRLLLSQGSKGCTVGNIERISDLGDKINGYVLNATMNDVEGTLEIIFDEAKAKRSDSPDLTDYYSVSFDGKPLPTGTYYYDINEVIIEKFEKANYNEVIINGENIPISSATKITVKASDTTQKTPHSLQQIFYGAPGTGKSHKVKEITGEDKEGDKPNVFRTTFHPDTDYASFVGCYKPVMKPVPDKYQAVAGRDEDIAYEFVPQAFTDAYVYAYNHANEPTYLVIEEINRGNCAQIFGDLFQLLDRNENGTSDYKIKADKDLAKYLSASLNSEDGIKDGKLSLPANLYILATMNTSDQSLFPIDSAFKRRWDWEYVAIDYNEHKSSAFEIKIGVDTYSWVEFIKKVNKRIYDVTQSEDKMMGNFFIKSSVDQKQFCSKVMFYLWNEVLKDEVENTKYFFYEDKGNNQTAKFTFTDIYSENATEILVNFMKYIGFTDKKTQETPNPNQPAEGEAQ